MTATGIEVFTTVYNYSYTYDVNGLRKSKTVDGETITHIRNGNRQIIADVTEGTIIKSNIITESDAIKILANPNEFEGIYTFENSYAKELAQKASKMKEPIVHTDANMLFNYFQQEFPHL